MEGTRQPHAGCHKGNLSSIYIMSWRCHSPAEKLSFLRRSVRGGSFKSSGEPGILGEQTHQGPPAPLRLHFDLHQWGNEREQAWKSNLPGSVSQLCHLLSLWPWVSHLPSLSLWFLWGLHEMKDMRAPGTQIMFKRRKVGFISISPPGHIRSSTKTLHVRIITSKDDKNWHQVGTHPSRHFHMPYVHVYACPLRRVIYVNVILCILFWTVLFCIHQCILEAYSC